MSGAWLFTRTRRWPLCLAVIATTGLLITACGPLSYSLNPRGGYRVAAASQLPLLAALTIQGALTPALARQERESPRRLWPWRLLHVLALTAVAAASVGTAALFIQPPAGVLLNASAPLGPLGLIRNLLAFTGAAFATATLLGSALGWLLPLAWAILPAIGIANAANDPSGLLRLPTQPDNAALPLTFACAIWLLGAVLTITNDQPLRIRRATA